MYVPPAVSLNGKLRAGRYYFARCQCPPDVLQAFVHRKQYIGQLELLAAVAAYTTFPDILRGRRVIHWIDNTSALAGLIKGYARAPDSARIVHAFHAFNAGLQADVRFEYVAFKANIADMPSRGDVSLLRRLNAQERECVLPEVDAWSADAEFVFNSQFRIGIAGDWLCTSPRPRS